MNERYTNRNQKQSYFNKRPDIVKIFEDLEQFHDFCRMEMLPFNPAHLYKKEHFAWRNYEKSLRK